jgi:membrane protein DedA with SNARE-associated domain
MSDWAVRLIDQSGYLGIGFLMFLETIFPPIPSEVIMPVAGVAAGQGKLHYGLVVASGTTGAMLGNIVWYLAARALGLDRLHPIIDRWGRWLTITWPEVKRADQWFRDHGMAFVLLGRLVPTVRSLVSVPAGLLHMQFRRFLLASIIGTAGWTAILAAAGFKLGENYERIDDFIGPASNAVLIVLGIGYVWRVWTHRNYQPPAEEPDQARG